MFVCSKTPPREVITGVHIWYGSKRNLSGKVLFVIKIPSDQPFGRYCPKSGHLSKKSRFFSRFSKQLTVLRESYRPETLIQGKR